MKSVICLLVVVSLCVFLVDCQRSTNRTSRRNGGTGGGTRRVGAGGGGRRFGGRRFFGRFSFNAGSWSKWNRTLDTSEITQLGQSNATDSLVTVMTFDRRLRDLGFEGGIVLYDFSNPLQQYTVLKGGYSCYILPNTVNTYVQASGFVSARNGTLVSLSEVLTQLYLNASGQQMSDGDRASLAASNPHVDQFCLNLNLYTPVAVDAASFPTSDVVGDGFRLVRVLTLDADVNMVVDFSLPQPSRRVGGTSVGGPSAGGQSGPVAGGSGGRRGSGSVGSGSVGSGSLGSGSLGSESLGSGPLAGGVLPNLGSGSVGSGSLGSGSLAGAPLAGGALGSGPLPNLGGGPLAGFPRGLQGGPRPAGS